MTEADKNNFSFDLGGRRLESRRWQMQSSCRSGAGRSPDYGYLVRIVVEWLGQQYLSIPVFSPQKPPA